MGLMKELNDLNSIYQNMYSEDENKGYVVTAADKKGNTPAWQGYKSGKKKKDGKPMYRAADHLKNESVGTAVDKTLDAAGDIASTAVKGGAKAVGYLVGLPKGIKKSAKKGHSKAAQASEGYEATKKKEVLGAMEKQGRKLSKKDKNKIADKVVKDKGDTSKSDDRYAYESVTPEVEKLIESGLFSAKEIANIADIQEADIADILAQLEKKRIRQGGNPDDSPLGKKTGRAMKAQQDKARSKK